MMLIFNTDLLTLYSSEDELIYTEFCHSLASYCCFYGCAIPSHKTFASLSGAHLLFFAYAACRLATELVLLFCNIYLSVYIRLFFYTPRGVYTLEFQHAIYCMMTSPRHRYYLNV